MLIVAIKITLIHLPTFIFEQDAFRNKKKGIWSISHFQVKCCFLCAQNSLILVITSDSHTAISFVSKFNVTYFVITRPFHVIMHKF